MSTTQKAILVCVSALAVIAAPLRARAAPTISCTRPMSFGTFLPQCNGTITVRASVGSGTANNGCHSQLGGVVQPAICVIQTTIGTATQDARITFTTTERKFANTQGGGEVTLDGYLIQTAGGSQAGTHTFNAALLDPGHTFNVGGRLRFGSGELAGSYDTTFNIVVTSIP